MDGRGAPCAHCIREEAEEPCPRCRQVICISCLLDGTACRGEDRTLGGEPTERARAIATLAACGIDVAGSRLVAADLPLWAIASVRVAPLGDPVPGQPDVLALSVSVSPGEAVEVLRRSEARDVDEVHNAARALSALTGVLVTYSDGDGDDALELAPRKRG